MRKSNFFLILLVSFAMAAAVATQGQAQEFATMYVSADGISFQTDNRFATTLDIAGPGGTVSAGFGAGEIPMAAISDESGQPLADGVYKYSLSAYQPTDDLVEALEAAREAGDEDEIERLINLSQSDTYTHPVATQGGSFEIVDGFIVLPDQPEEEEVSANQHTHNDGHTHDHSN